MYTSLCADIADSTISLLAQLSKTHHSCIVFSPHPLQVSGGDVVVGKHLDVVFENAHRLKQAGGRFRVRFVGLHDAAYKEYAAAVRAALGECTKLKRGAYRDIFTKHCAKQAFSTMLKEATPNCPANRVVSVSAEGDIAVCCHDINLVDRLFSVYDYMDGDELARVRDEMIRERIVSKQLALCSGCSAYPQLRARYGFADADRCAILP